MFNWLWWGSTVSIVSNKLTIVQSVDILNCLSCLWAPSKVVHEVSQQIRMFVKPLGRQCIGDLIKWRPASLLFTKHVMTSALRMLGKFENLFFDIQKKTFCSGSEG